MHVRDRCSGEYDQEAIMSYAKQNPDGSFSNVWDWRDATHVWDSDALGFVPLKKTYKDLLKARAIPKDQPVVIPKDVFAFVPMRPSETGHSWMDATVNAVQAARSVIPPDATIRIDADAGALECIGRMYLDFKRATGHAPSVLLVNREDYHRALAAVTQTYPTWEIVFVRCFDFDEATHWQREDRIEPLDPRRRAALAATWSCPGGCFLWSAPGLGHDKGCCDACHGKGPDPRPPGDPPILYRIAR
jgi:hypothetical protein